MDLISNPLFFALLVSLTTNFLLILLCMAIIRAKISRVDTTSEGAENESSR